MDDHTEWPRVDGKYLEDDVVDLPQTDEVLKRFPDGHIPVGQYMGMSGFSEDGSLVQVHYLVTETWPEFPFRVRIKKHF